MFRQRAIGVVGCYLARSDPARSLSWKDVVGPHVTWIYIHCPKRCGWLITWYFLLNYIIDHSDFCRSNPAGLASKSMQASREAA